MKARSGGKSFEIRDELVRGKQPMVRKINHHHAEDSLRKSCPAPPLSLCFTLWGQIPSGKNAVLITRTGRRYPAKRFQAWRNEAMRQLPPVAGPFVGPLHLIVDYVKGDLRRRDLPGMTDALLHLIEKAGYVLDDAQVVQQTWTPFPIDRTRPRCTITLSPITRNLDEEEP